MKGKKATSDAGKRAFRDGANGTYQRNVAAVKSKPRPVFRQPKTELEQAIERYVDLFDFAPIAYVTFDRAGRVEQVNFAAARLLRRSRRQLIGITFAVCITKEDTPLFLHHLMECRSSDDAAVTELCLKGIDGEKIPVLLSTTGTSGLMKDGARLYQTAIIDLTERKRFEHTIRRSEERYRTLFNLGPTAVYTIDTSGVIQEYNRQAVELWGREPALGDTDQRFCGSFKMFRPDGSLMPHDQCPMAEVVSGKISVVHNGEVLIERPDGSHVTVLVNIRPLKNDRGEITGAINCFYDITDRKQTEEQLAEQARLLDLTIDAILVRDAQDRITYWNHGARELYGYSREEALGKVTHELLRTVHSQSLIHIRKKLERDNRWSGELVHTCKDGTKVIVISRWSLDRDAKGMPASILETNTEITNRKRAEQRRSVDLAVTRTLSESRSLDEAVPRILRTVCETLGWEVGDFWAPNTTGGRVLRCLEVRGSSVAKFPKFKAASRKLELAPGMGLPGRAWSNLKPVWISDVTRDNNVPRASIAAEEGLHAGFAFPISFGKNFLGVMEFFSLEIRKLDEDLLKMFAGIGSQIGQFVQRKRAEDAAQKSKELLERLVQQRTKALRVTNAKLENEIERRKGLEGEILSVSDREQQRLGQELHDGLCQHLTAVAFMAHSIAMRLKNHRVIDAADIEKIAQLVNDAASDTRNLSRALHRMDVDAAGLVTALQDLVDREIWRTPCRLQVRPSFRIDDDSAAAHLFRIAREAVINANKHAQAREIVVKLENSRQGMVLRVIDDGVGCLNAAKLKQGLGFHIMNYRAQLMGGRLEIDSPKTGGTCVSCYLPRRVSPSRNAKNGEQPAELTETVPSGAAAVVPSFRHLKRQGAAIG